jgi:hypothetical protein
MPDRVYITTRLYGRKLTWSTWMEKIIKSTTIEDLEHRVQGPRESTRRWVWMWQDLWMEVSSIRTDTAIHCFKTTCRYEPQSKKPV